MLVTSRLGPPRWLRVFIFGIFEINSDYSMYNPEQTWKVLVSDWITNTRYDYELRDKTIRRQMSEKESILLEKNVNDGSNHEC